MVGASKILTVSYGTFSCTLEGFDDPFSTMRSIAEYFRDLAADDRYFGAEPPTPDAEMLHRIAEKEIQRRVEARVQDNGIVLKQLSDDEVTSRVAATAGGATAFAPAYAPESDDDADLEPGMDDAAFPDVEEVAEVTADSEALSTETVAEKLSRIRAVVSSARAAEAAQEDTADLDTADLAAQDDVMEAVRDAADMEDEGFDGDATEKDIAEALSAFDTAEETEADAGDAAQEPREEPTVPVADHDEPVVAMDVDAETSDEADEETWPEEAWDTPMIAALDEDTDEDTDEDVEAAAPVHDGAEADEVETASADSGEPYGRVVHLSRPDLEAALGTWDDAEVDAAADDHAVAAPEGETGLGSEIDGSDEEDHAKGDDWDKFDEDESEVAEDIEPVEDDEDDRSATWAAGSEVGGDVEDDAGVEAEATVEDDAEDVAEDDSIAVGIRAALGQQLQSEDDEDEDDGEDWDRADETGTPDADAWSWQDDAEAAEAGDDEADDDEDHDLSAGSIAARERLGTLSEPEGDAADVDRLLEKTNSQMAETENSRRRSAIAHLKAAVAATKADRLLKRVTSRERTDAEEQTQYRDDLAHVVRPRRPASETAEAARERPKPLGDGKSPLMLVSELRVDGETTDYSAIRPRRIMQDDEFESAADAESSGYEDAASFADFAEKMGATELPDLLEAAAAYAAFVENRPHFSRPQLMKRVAKFDAGGEFTREAGLRSFGQLLRQGKIRKLKRGQFTVADTTRFNPEARIAGE
jgi:hypothetical protein